MKINDLFEARRNANHPAQELTRMSKVGSHNANYYLNKYKDDPNVYVSFSTIPKLGIKPTSSWNTPQGIYFYPLSSIYSDNSDFNKIVPYAGDRPYMYIVRSKVNLTNVEKYSAADLERDTKKIIEIFGQDVFNRIKTITDEYQTKTPAKQLWKYGWAYSRFLDDDENVSMTVKYVKFFKKLGHYGFDDRKSSGTISMSEPSQTVFFSTKYFEVLEFITFHKKIDQYSHDKEPNISSIPDFNKMSKDERFEFFTNHPKLAAKYANKEISLSMLTGLDPYVYKDVFFTLASKYPEIIPKVLDYHDDNHLPLYVLTTASKKNSSIIPKLLQNDYVDEDFIRWVLKYYPEYINELDDENLFKQHYIKGNKK